MGGALPAPLRRLGGGMSAGERFVPEGDDARREKAAARELRQSGWWKRRVADGRCHYCRRAVGAHRLTLDHVVHLIRGGRSVRSKVVPAYKECSEHKEWFLPC